jgi:transposase-like protein
VIETIADPSARKHTMTDRIGRNGAFDAKALPLADEDFLRTLMRTALQEVLEAELAEAVSAPKG